MPVLVSETRQQSTEMRLLQEKVDKVSKIFLSHLLVLWNCLLSNGYVDQTCAFRFT